MEDYKLRMINEYKELKGKYDRLHRMLVKYDAGKLDFTPTCPIDLLRKQASIMGQYLYILETRAVIEGINLNAEEKKKEEPDAEKPAEKPALSALEELLFERTHLRDVQYHTTLSAVSLSRYNNLHSLIIDADLKEKYNFWKAVNGYE